MPIVVKPPARKKQKPAKPRSRKATKVVLETPKPKVRPAAKKATPATPPAKKASRARPPSSTTVGVEQPTSWAELAGKAPAADARRKERAPGFVDAYSTLRFGLILALACAAVTLFVGHLYSSQALVQEVQELRRDQLRLALQHNRLRGEFDRMTAPAVILQRAEGLGLRTSGEYAPTIIVAD